VVNLPFSKRPFNGSPVEGSDGERGGPCGCLGQRGHPLGDGCSHKRSQAPHDELAPAARGFPEVESRLFVVTGAEHSSARNRPPAATRYNTQTSDLFTSLKFFGTFRLLLSFPQLTREPRDR
jgi:hypothetical protein